MSLLRRPVVLMVIGVLVLGLAGVRFATRDTTKVDPAAATRCVFPPCRASADPVPARGHEGGYVAADPTDPEHVVIADTDVLASACGFHTTFNRGKDWSEGPFTLPPGFTGCRLNGPSGGHVPSGSVALGSAGRVYSVFGSANADDGRRESVLVVTSTDGGRTFAPAKVAIRPPSSDIGLGRPLMTVAPGQGGGGKDTLLLSSWACHPAVGSAGTACDGALFARSDDGGETYTAPVTVNGPPAGQNPSQPAIDRDGTVYETYQQRFSDGPVSLFVAKSVDGGRTFTSSVVEQQVQIGVQYDPAKIVADPRSGTLYMVWADGRTGRTQIFLRSSTDKGVTWGDKPLLVSTDPGNTGSSRSPSISVAPNGRVDIVYYHTPAAADRQNFDDVYWNYSVDGGERTTSRQVNEQPIDRNKGYSGPASSIRLLGNHYPPTVSSTDTAAYVVWSDTRDATDVTNTQDVVLRRMDLLEATPP